MEDDMPRQPQPARGQSWEHKHHQLIVRIIQITGSTIRVQNEKNDSVFNIGWDNFHSMYKYVGTY